MPDESDEFDQLLAELRARVEARKADGLYPLELEATLDEHFERLVGERPAASPALYDELERTRNELAHFEYSRARIDPSSSYVGGTAVHRVIAATVARQIQGVLQQTQEHSQVVGKAITLLTDLVSALGREYDGRVVQQLDDIQVKLAELSRAPNAREAKIPDSADRLPGASLHPFYREDHFTAHFRGSAEVVRDRYRDLASYFDGSEPVLELGFGRGEFLELLTERGIEARGVEPDPMLVSNARGRGLDVAEGRAVEYLETLADSSLGGIVMVQVIEHLSPQQMIDVVRLASEKLRVGGKILIETVNPASLFIYARAFWIDPDHVRPVHPAFLEFVLKEAGFGEMERLDRSPVPSDESLEMLPGDDELTKRLNENFERLNALVFGAQDYAFLAVRVS